MSSLQAISTKEAWEQFASAIPSNTLQIIYFKAEWAAPCKQMTTVLETLANSYPVTDPLSTSWVSIDAEEAIDVSDIFDVATVPLVILRRGNQVIEKISGSDASKVRIAIEKSLNLPQTQPAASDIASQNKLVSDVLGPDELKTSDPTVIPENKAGGERDEKNELHKRLANLVKAAPIMLFMKGTPAAPQCGFSRQIVSLLRESNVKYGFFNILADDDVRQGLKEFAAWPTYPQLWVKGELVGGLDIVKEELENNPDFLKSCNTDVTSISAN